jgi:DNA-binding NarL/FixJ family response regulator
MGELGVSWRFWRQGQHVKPAKVLLADAHLLFTETLSAILQNECEVVGIANDRRMMVEMAKKHQPDVIVADVEMPHLDGISALRILRKEVPLAKVLLLTMHTDIPLLEEACRAGAKGIVLKAGTFEELVMAIHAVARGATYITPLIDLDVISTMKAARPQKHSKGIPLPPRQFELLRLLGGGKTVKEAAVIMAISKRTAECHKYEIMKRLGIKTTAELIRYAIRFEPPRETISE